MTNIISANGWKSPFSFAVVDGAQHATYAFEPAHGKYGPSNLGFVSVTHGSWPPDDREPFSLFDGYNKKYIGSVYRTPNGAAEFRLTNKSREHPMRHSFLVDLLQWAIPYIDRGAAPEEANRQILAWNDSQHLRQV